MKKALSILFSFLPLVVGSSAVHNYQNKHALQGKASWYGGIFHGRTMANGEIFDKYELTAAHKTLPFGTKVLVINRNNQKEVEVEITDRGPYIKGRIIDLSRKAFEEIADLDEGVISVEMKLL